MLKTPLCDLFGIKYPVFQGAMAHLATAELVSAVSNAGGLGVIAAANYGADWLAYQIALTRNLTALPFGVNLFLPSPVIQEQIELILKEKVGIVVTGAGNPAEYLPILQKGGIKVISVASNVAMSIKLEKMGVDVIVVEGTEAGGHVGLSTTMTLVPQVFDAVGVPLIAAGGVADGRGMAAAFALGAQGIQMGTRFICSFECCANPGFKDKILRSEGGSTVITGNFTGSTTRCLNNAFAQSLIALEKGGATTEEMAMYSHGRLFKGIIEGDLEEGWLMAGQVSGMIHEIKTVQSIIEDTVTQAEKILSRLCDEALGRNANAG